MSELKFLPNPTVQRVTSYVSICQLQPVTSTHKTYVVILFTEDDLVFSAFHRIGTKLNQRVGVLQVN